MISLVRRKVRSLGFFRIVGAGGIGNLRQLQLEVLNNLNAKLRRRRTTQTVFSSCRPTMKGELLQFPSITCTTTSADMHIMEDTSVFYISRRRSSSRSFEKRHLQMNDKNHGTLDTVFSLIRCYRKLLISRGKHRCLATESECR